MQKKVLIIDDCSENLEELKWVFEQENYEVYAALNGKSGLKLITEVLPDMILCDVAMPEMNGYEVKELLSCNRDTYNLPFVFVADSASIKEIRYGMELGADDYIVRPFNNKEIVRIVNTRLKRIDELAKWKLVKSSRFESKNVEIPEEKDHIIVNTDQKPVFLKTTDVVYVDVQSKYSTLHLASGEEFQVKKPIKEWEEVLPKKLFFRIHKSVIVNLHYITSLDKLYKRSFIVHLKGIEIPFIVSQRYSAKLRSNLMV
ncbi:MAG: LytTR family DNA-binding domain-containing protein [Bacteroidota bacterium]|nr:LytTR family DNA-binding domain-containing protein [Bacteroidota bacterium]